MNNSPRNVVADIVAIAHADLRRNFRDRAMTARDPDTAASRLLADVDDPAERGGSEIAGDRGETVARRNKSRGDPLISHARARARTLLSRGIAASRRRGESARCYRESHVDRKRNRKNRSEFTANSNFLARCGIIS